MLKKKASRWGGFSKVLEQVKLYTQIARVIGVPGSNKAAEFEEAAGEIAVIVRKATTRGEAVE